MTWMRYYKKKKSSLTESNAYAACIKKLNYRDYSCGELREFLLEQEDLNREFIENLLAELLEFGYINEKRFAESIYSSWLHGSYKGKYYLLNKLNKYKITAEVVAQYQTMDMSALELERAVTLLQKYLAVKKLSLVENRAKVAGYLKNQYYEPDIINQAINCIAKISK